MSGIPLNLMCDRDRRAIRLQLSRILNSGLFASSRRRQRFLEFVVGETLAGRGERLKGYTIGLEVFDRSTTFDPVLDPIVRVEAARLREKLRDYYASQGRYDSIRIDLPKGTYEPRITLRKVDEPIAEPAAPGSRQAVDLFGTRDIDSHSELLRGLKEFWHYTRAACALSQRHFAHAAELDPDHSAAHVWLARTHVWEACMNWTSSASVSIERAHTHARRAIALDEASPLAHSVLGKVSLYLRDGETAVAEARRACAIDPHSADAKMFLAFILACTGRGQSALGVMNAAMVQQPYPTSYYLETLGLCHFALGDYERAIAAFLEGIDLNPSYMPCHYELAIVNGVLGRVWHARSEAAIVKADCPTVSTDFMIDPRLADTYMRGKSAAGLD